MKNNRYKLLAFLITGCIAINGCGESDTPQDTEETTEEKNTESQTTEPETTASPTDANSLEAQIPGLFMNSTASADDQSDIPAPRTETESSSGIIAGEEHTVVGIITDATKYSLAFQTPDGNSYYLTIPETGVKGNLSYITIGQLATLTYVGYLDESAALTGISDSSMITGIYVEEYAFAIKIINAVRSMDMKALSDLTNFPVFIDTGNYSGPMNTSGEFEAINNEKIFTEALVSRISNYNLFDLKYTDAGFVMGNGTPSITFDVDDDGILGIIGINSAAATTNTDS